MQVIFVQRFMSEGQAKTSRTLHAHPSTWSSIRQHGYFVCWYVMQGSHRFRRFSVSILSALLDDCYIRANRRFN